MIFICATAITGTASANISANGGDAARDTTNAASISAQGGQGAFSRTVSGTSSGTLVAERWSGRLAITGPMPFHMLLGDGGGTVLGGQGGGSGGTATGVGGGGSGIGGGSDSSGLAPSNPLIVEVSPLHLLELGLAGGLGGGGGGCRVHTTGTSNSAGGGGGGSVVLWVRTNTSAPTLAAAGGAGIGAAITGAAGVTYTIVVP